MLWHGSDICKVLQNPPPPNSPPNNWQAGKIAIDSRTLQAGDVFVALKGDNFDGHEFIDHALEKGAAAIIGERFASDAQKNGNVPHLQVADSLTALQDLARFRRQNLTAKIIGITGSVGKTSTKEMLQTALSACGACYASAGNFNNHIGLPLMLANAPQEADYLIFEMGMNHAGEIKFLTELAEPDLAIITNVKPAHMMNFANLQAVAAAKAEIFLSSPDMALFIGDDAQISPILRQAASHAKVKDMRSFGRGDNVDYRLTDSRTHKAMNRVSGDFRGQCLTYDIGALGQHPALNSVAVLAAVDMLTGSIENPDCLRIVKAPEGRGALSQIALSEGGQAWLIDESYNASPAAVEASLALLAEVKATHKSRRAVAILGDMLELGDEEIAYHVSLKEALQNCRIDKLITVGKRARHLYEAVPQEMRLKAYDERADLMKDIWNLLENDDILLLKASNSVGLGEVVAQLKGN